MAKSATKQPAALPAIPRTPQVRLTPIMTELASNVFILARMGL